MSDLCLFRRNIIQEHSGKKTEVYHNFLNYILRKIDMQFSTSLRYLNKYPGLGFCIRTNWATLKTEGNVSKPVSVIEVTETYYKHSWVSGILVRFLMKKM